MILGVGRGRGFLRESARESSGEGGFRDECLPSSSCLLPLRILATVDGCESAGEVMLELQCHACCSASVSNGMFWSRAIFHPNFFHKAPPWCTFCRKMFSNLAYRSQEELQQGRRQTTSAGRRRAGAHIRIKGGWARAIGMEPERRPRQARHTMKQGSSKDDCNNYTDPNNLRFWVPKHPVPKGRRLSAHK